MYMPLCCTADPGKSILVVWWLLDIRERSPDEVPYARFDAGGPAHTHDRGVVLVGFLFALGAAQDVLPVDVDYCVALYRTLTAHRALVVLLDDVEHTEQVTPLLPSGSACLVVTTSRHPLGSLIEHGARVHRVGPLDHADGLALFQGITGPDRVHSDRPAAARLVELCCGRPLTIAACAAAAAIRPGVPLADLVDDLNRPLDMLDRNGDILVNHAVQADYDGLTPLGQALFRLIGVQPTSRFSFRMLTALLPPAQARPLPVGTRTADYDHGLDPSGPRSRRDSRVRRVIDELTGAALLVGHPLDTAPVSAAIDPTGMSGPVWTIEAVPHQVARELADTLDLPEVRAAAVVRVVDQVLWPALHAADILITPYRRRTPYPVPSEDLARFGEVVFADRAQALTWLDLHVDTLAAYAHALYAAGEYRRALLLVDALWPLWLHRKHYELRLELDALALRAAGELGDEAARAEMLKRIGLVQISLGGYEEAHEALRAALALRLTLRDQWGQADCRNALGLYHRAVGDSDFAATQFRLAANTYRAVGALREQGLANHNLGALQVDTGQYSLAVVQLQRTAEEFAALAEPDEYNALRVRIDLARAHLGLRHYRAARDLAVEAADGMALVGNPAERARAVEVLADIAQATDDPSYPQRLAEALALYESVNSPRTDRLRTRLAAATAQDER
ncbi:tetratricopeptide repeat protein [Saccharothrix syringae]|uniref:Tetratricopeptide repeat protein n=1 Tax=Saccharothrix syringae TaxID=103733 RepID=A0A5Q0H2R8_SACSY|nr:tetratricopeptide repeat protein [Saccharothrix syringae]